MMTNELSALMSGGMGSGVAVWLVIGIQGALLLGAVMLIGTVARGLSAATRHALLGAGIIATLILPAAELLPWRIPVLPGFQGATSGDATTDFRLIPGTVERSPREGYRPAANESRGLDDGPGATSFERSPVVESTDVPTSGGSGTPFSLAAALWVIGVVLVGGRMLISQARARGIVKRSGRLEDAGWQRLLWESADRLDIATDVELLRSADVRIAFATGALAPVIVMPASGDRWDEERRRAVLMHELAHIRRRDLIFHHASRIACALYWFNPLVWMAARRLRAESERAADDMVLAVGTRPSDYADHILQIVAESGRIAMPAPLLSFARKRELEGRIVSILEPDLARSGPTRMQSALLTTAIVFLTLPLAALSPAEPASPRSLAVDSANPLPSGEPGRTGSRESSTNTLGRERRTEVDEEGSPEEIVQADGRSYSNGQKANAQTDDPRTAGDARRDTPVAEVRALVVESFRRAGNSSNDRTAISALLAESDDPRAIAALIELLRNDPVADVRVSAAWGLGELKAVEAVEALSLALLNDSNVRVREAAARALAEIEDPSAVEALLLAVEDDEGRVRDMAIMALGEIESIDAAGPLRRFLSSDNPQTRQYAAIALGELHLDVAPQELIAALDDPDPRVRAGAVSALAEIQDARALPALTRLLNDSDESVRRFALWAISEIGSVESIEAILPMVSDTSPEIRMAAAAALAESESTQAIPALEALVRDPDPRVRETAVWAITEIDAQESVEALIRALQDDDPDVRRMAAQALAEL